MPINIRKAVPSDSPGIARVHVASWRTSYKGLMSEEFLQNLSVERREQAWHVVLTTPEHPAFLYVAEDEGGEIIGFVSGRPERENDTRYTGEVGAIYLLKQAQGQGTGRRLMQAAGRELVQRGHTAMLLWVLKDNIAARKFYEALGGKYLREKPIEIGNETLLEVAYGWDDLSTLAKE
jgi:GNAT superfamily N-acetyltransferase